MKKVMVFGVFDLLHPGHISFLRQAKKYGSLIVSVARDANVKKIKGKLPIFDEKKRVEHVKQLKVAQKVVLAGLKDPWPHIKKEKPDVIALGYDQDSYVSKQKTVSSKQITFQQELRKRGLNARVIRLKAFRPEVFKSSLMRKKHK